MSETLYHVSANPHVRDNGSTQKIMLDVIIALLPATIFGIYIFGASAALTVAISVATCVVLLGLGSFIQSLVYNISI